MKLSFESNLDHQLKAFKSITDIFEGQPLEDSLVEFNLNEEGTLGYNGSICATDFGLNCAKKVAFLVRWTPSIPLGGVASEKPAHYVQSAFYVFEAD